MKRLIAVMLCLCMIFSLAACGEGTSADSSTAVLPAASASASSQTTALENEAGIAPASPPSAGEHAASPDPEQKILIAYFTWAENTYVENPDAVDVDASTSASVLSPGNAAKIAGWIQQRTGDDLFSIVVTEPYSSNYDECLDRAAEEEAENTRPELTDHVENMEDYDIVFLGFPNWWYTVPMAIHSFLEEYDFSGKTVIPFVTHGTGGLASTIEDITADLPDSTTILEPIGVYRPEVDEAQPAVNAWLDGLGFTDPIPPEQTNAAAADTNTLTLVVDGQEIPITLYDTPAANALYNILPLELQFEDFNHTEKISDLPEELPTEGESDGCDPDIGDFCLYAPWGNLSIFYQDFPYSDGLIPLGHVDAGMDLIANQTGNFSATLKRTE